MKNEKIYPYLIVVYALTVITGLALASSATFYKTYRDSIAQSRVVSEKERLSGAIRAFLLESFNPETGTAIVSILDRYTNANIRMQVRVSLNTTIFKRDLIRYDGVVVGLTPLVNGSFSDLTPGIRGTMAISYTEDGKINAKSIVVGEPFPRM